MLLRGDGESKVSQCPSNAHLALPSVSSMELGSDRWCNECSDRLHQITVVCSKQFCRLRLGKIKLLDLRFQVLSAIYNN